VCLWQTDLNTGLIFIFLFNNCTRKLEYLTGIKLHTPKQLGRYTFLHDLYFILLAKKGKESR
jgi:hypothetical protein